MRILALAGSVSLLVATPCNGLEIPMRRCLQDGWRNLRRQSAEPASSHQKDIAALVDGRVLGAGFRKSRPEVQQLLGTPAKLNGAKWLLSGLWWESTAFSTGCRVLLPAAVVGLMCSKLFEPLCRLVATCFLPASLDASNALLQQIVPLLGLVFSVFTNNTFQAMYEQQEAALLALFREVSIAKSLVEQLTLVLGGAGEAACIEALRCVRRYASRDLRRRSDESAAQLRLALSRDNPCESVTTCYRLADPLEELLYLTSVGAPSEHCYATVKDLRAARATRLGALERKLPVIQFVLLYGLGAALLSAFVLQAAATTCTTGAHLEFETTVFAVCAAALVACLRVLQDIWSPKSGAYNVDALLVTCVMGLERQLDDLLATATYKQLAAPSESFAEIELRQGPRS